MANRFFKYITECRVQNWYNHQVCDDINEKYTIEQEISKLILIWTLCGLISAFGQVLVLVKCVLIGVKFIFRMCSSGFNVIYQYKFFDKGL